MFFLVDGVTLGEQQGNVRLQLKMETYLRSGVVRREAGNRKQDEDDRGRSVGGLRCVYAGAYIYRWRGDRPASAVQHIVGGNEDTGCKYFPRKKKDGGWPCQTASLAGADARSDVALRFAEVQRRRDVQGLGPGYLPLTGCAVYGDPDAGREPGEASSTGTAATPTYQPETVRLCAAQER